MTPAVGRDSADPPALRGMRTWTVAIVVIVATAGTVVGIRRLLVP